MRHAATVMGWVAALAVSASAHGLLLAVPLGQSGSTSNESTVSTPAEVEVEVEPVPTPATPDDVPLPNQDNPQPVPVAAATRQDAHSARAPSSPAQQAPSARPDDPTAMTADTPMPHFSIAISASDGQSLAQSSGGHASRRAQVDDSVPLAEHAVDTPARLLRGETPSYPADARADGVEGNVRLEIVLSRAGTVESVQVAQRVGHGLDEAAVASASRFRFSPALKEGQAVRVRVGWTVEFRLQ